MTKFKSYRLNEVAVDKASVLKAVAKAPDSDVRDFRFIEMIFDEVVDCESLIPFKNVSEWCNDGSLGAEDLVWTCLNSKMPPESYGYDEPIIYDTKSDQIIGLKNKKFNAKKLAELIKKSDFDLYDDTEEATLFIAKYK